MGEFLTAAVVGRPRPVEERIEEGVQGGIGYAKGNGSHDIECANCDLSVSLSDFF
jgi:hypothetical protein